MTPKTSGICQNCKNLEVWPGIFSARFLCFKKETSKHFGNFGRPVGKGPPPVKRCKHFETGRQHTSL